MEFERLIEEQLQGASASTGGYVGSIRQPGDASIKTVAAGAPVSALYRYASQSSSTYGTMPDPASISTSTFKQNQQKVRIDALDRRCLSLFASVEDIQRTVSNLELTCSRQALDSQVRHTVMEVLRPVVLSMQEQTRADLARILNDMSSISSKATSAFNTASSARAEVSALTAAQTVPNVHRILDGTVDRGYGSRSVHSANGAAYFNSHADFERSRELEGKRQELMWERIDNHLACFEIRLRKKVDSVVQAAILRGSAEAQARSREPTGQLESGDAAKAKALGKYLSVSPSRARGDGALQPRRSWDEEEYVGINDFLLLQRRLDELVLTVHGVAQASGGGGNIFTTRLGSKNIGSEFNSDDGDLAGDDRDILTSNVDGIMSSSPSPSPSPSPSVTKHKQGNDEADFEKRANLSLDEANRGTLQLLQTQMLKMQDDLISVKLESSSRLERIGQLEKEVKSLKRSMQRTGETSSPKSPSLSSVSFECVGEGKPIHEWTVNDVDQWLMLIGTKEAVRRRFLQLEIDGEMLSLLEKSDLGGDVSEAGVKTGMDIPKAFGGTIQEGADEVNRLMIEISKLKVAHGSSISPGTLDEATDGEDGVSDYTSSAASPASSKGSPSTLSKNDMSPTSTDRAVELESIRKQLASYGYTNT